MLNEKKHELSNKSGNIRGPGSCRSPGVCMDRKALQGEQLFFKKYSKAESNNKHEISHHKFEPCLHKTNCSFYKKST